MNVLNKRVSRLEVQLARCVDSERQNRSIVEKIFKNRRRLEGLPPEETRPPATPPDASRQSKSIAEAIWRARAARMNQARADDSPRQE